MKTITFLDLGGQGSVDHPDTGLGWTRGESKVVTDAQAALLLTNPNFSESDEHTAPAPSASSYGEYEGEN